MLLKINRKNKYIVNFHVILKLIVLDKKKLTLIKINYAKS